ncbi:MAG: heavy-metal-associated domain-containing protein [Nitrospirae bacterium]|nr:heavy-metal-associated domain-containing protein [Nitrospirota bacterium]MBI3593908.1 heavy-metal-associated domain-containing protein [Nitrospirota bacterium]
METINLNVTGMTCQHCVQSVKGALEKLHGVNSVSVVLDQGNVKIEFDSALVNLQQLRGAVVEAGYEVS